MNVSELKSGVNIIGVNSSIGIQAIRMVNK